MGRVGGERKAVHLTPLTRLDSASALSLCETLKSLAASGSCTVICTIHQPQSKIFALFDELVILNKGHVLYKGPREEVLEVYAGNLFSHSSSSSCYPDFSSMLIQFIDAGLPCPNLTNPADHILDVITFVPGSDAEQIGTYSSLWSPS